MNACPSVWWASRPAQRHDGRNDEDRPSRVDDRMVSPVTGVQGHSAYPHRAKNPLPAMARLMDRLASHELDQGTDHFDASTLASVTTIDTGNPATNVIPAALQLGAVNIRFNDLHSGASLTIGCATRGRSGPRELLALRSTMKIKISGESFLTPPGPFVGSGRPRRSKAETGRVGLSCPPSGGTSDARFVKHHCPVVEFGLVGRNPCTRSMNASKWPRSSSSRRSMARILQDYFA